MNARFDSPAAMAIDTAGNLYIADFYNNVVRFVSGGRVTTIAGNGGLGVGAENIRATDGPLGGPAGVAVDAAGNLYIAEAYNNRVRKVANGMISTVAGTGTAGFSGDKGAATAATLRQPSDVAVDSSGTLYIADFGNNRIRVVTTSGVINTFAGNGTAVFTGDGGVPTSAGLAAPRRVALDGAGNLYIADGVRVRKAGKTITTIAGGGVPASRTVLRWGPRFQRRRASPWTRPGTYTSRMPAPGAS